MTGIEAYSEVQQRAARRILDSLDRSESRLEEHYSRLRAHPRSSFRGTAMVCIPDPDQPVLRPGDGRSTTVWARSISSAGLSLISPEQIYAKILLVGLEIPGSTTRWFNSEVVRERKIPEETFWEYGVAFRGVAVV